MNLAHHPSLQGRNASACHLTSKSKNRQTVKLTRSSSRPKSLERRYEGIQRRMTAKPPTYLFRYLSMSKSRGNKITEAASLYRRPVRSVISKLSSKLPQHFAPLPSEPSAFPPSVKRCLGAETKGGKREIQKKCCGCKIL